MTEEELARLAEKLDLRQRIRLLTGATTWRTHAEPVVGLAEMTTSDGPAGIRGEAWDERDTSLLLPSASALGALWDDGLVERLGGLLAAEAHRKGVDVVLAPNLNLHRSPLGGRHFECFAEDPLLTGRTGAALIRGIQRHGIAATAKHYVANDSETDRLTADVRVGERALREVYLAPFEAAVAAGVRVVMTGYNGVNGTTMTESPLLAEPLKGEWGFDGVVVSDWGAVRTTAPSARAALDLAMPGPGGPWAEALLRAVESGAVPVDAVDDKVRRLLRLAEWVGALGEGRGDNSVAGEGTSVGREGSVRPTTVYAGRDDFGGCGDSVGASEASTRRDDSVGPAGLSAGRDEVVGSPALSVERGDWVRLPAPSAERDDSVRPSAPFGEHDAAAQPSVLAAGRHDAVGWSAPCAEREAVGRSSGLSGERESAAQSSALSAEYEAAVRSSAPSAERKSSVESSVSSAERGLLRQVVAAGSVLLHNRGVLPLDREELGTVAVIGAHAAHPRTQGGGSAGVFPGRVVTFLDGIRRELDGRATVVHVPGPALDAPPPPLDASRCRDPRDGAPGVLLRVLDADGRELHAEHRLSGRLLEPPQPPGAHTVEISALLPSGSGGPWCFGVGGFGRMTLTVDGRDLIDDEFPPLTGDPAVLHVNPPGQYARTEVPGGKDLHVVARRELAPGTGRATVLSAAPPEPAPDAAVAEAVVAARRADAVVLVVGATENSESEGHDRTTLALPGHQDDLVRAVCAANPRTVVVLNTGSPVELPWRAEAGALLLTWFPGQEGGAGVADVLFGHVEPGGRLPTTWGAALGDVPVSRTRPEHGVLDYTEGLHIGYRAWLRAGREPAYWFGHGLGYTTWAYEGLTVLAEAPAAGREGGSGSGTADAVRTVRVRLRNTGRRRGREVVQVYLARPVSRVDRPLRWLAGYASVEADPGEEVTVAVRVPRRAFQHWCEEDGGWRTEPGEWLVLAGRSAGELPLRALVDDHHLDLGVSRYDA
ncbi:glycoside hydrolase family 3 C-terminal domain-containing protein [Streptomyces sp. NPDC000983]|uniref:glycoside hydrolase family 3 C-terminal domain-containing protein n=1 Tax=Streptomyces sp. NPDC000983 TaxID=3154373 RepID=UPI00331B8336